MKIAIVNEFQHVVGGIETYLSRLIPLLQESGHEIGVLCERIGDRNRASICTPDIVHAWNIEEIGESAATAGLLSFRPDVVFLHGTEDSQLEQWLIGLAPVVRFVHVFRGTCISSEKTRKFPVPAPCNRKFGPLCLLEYLPRRCGGSNPRTMLRLYQIEMKRQELLRQYRRVVCASTYMAKELGRHGVAATPIGLLLDRVEPQTNELAFPEIGRKWNLGFVGRMETLKGGALLIEALARAEAPTELNVTFAGDGREFGKLKELAERRLRPKGIEFQFAGWLNGEGLRELFRKLHLLVFPSIWPEPFGLSGLEAGLHSIPAVAFNVGGISDWLTDGVNGHLAAANPPCADALLAAISKALQRNTKYLALRQGARSVAEAFSSARHLNALLPLLEEASGVGDSVVQAVVLPARNVGCEALA